MASVLVVDDDAASREYLRALFTHSGHRVYEAADGNAALRMVDERPPDVVITDVLMPGMDGCELARTLRSRPRTALLPIAFNTAHYDQRGIQPMARACGVRDVIYKPAKPTAVLAVMNAMLERECAARALADRPASPGAARDITPIGRDQRLSIHTHAVRQAERLMRDQLHAAMVPRELPLVAALDLAAVYLTAQGRSDTGADWYDTLPLPDGRILLSVGSVAGHRMPGPAVAGPMRAMLRAYAVKNPDPADVLADMNRYLIATEFGTTYATALAALYDPASGHLDLANAGHPVPLLITHDAVTGVPRVRRLATADPPLGIREGVAFRTHRVALTPETTVCAYTDGLTDDYTQADSDVTLLIGTITATLTTAPGRQPFPAAQYVLNQVLRILLAIDVPQDDVCMVVLRAAGPHFRP